MGAFPIFTTMYKVANCSSAEQLTDNLSCLRLSLKEARSNQGQVHKSDSFTCTSNRSGDDNNNNYYFRSYYDYHYYYYYYYYYCYYYDYDYDYFGQSIKNTAVVTFCSRARIWGECSTIYSPPTLLFILFNQVEISSRKQIPLFRPGSVHSDSASCDDCNRVFPDELCVSSFPDRFPHSARTTAQSAHSDFDGSKVYAYLGVT